MFVVGYFDVPFTDALAYGYGNYSLDLAEKIINNKKNNYEKNSYHLDAKKSTIDIKKLMTIRESLNKLL